MAICPRGHPSGDDEYCDQCGAVMPGGPDGGPAPAVQPAAATGGVAAATQAPPAPAPPTAQSPPHAPAQSPPPPAPAPAQPRPGRRVLRRQPYHRSVTGRVAMISGVTVAALALLFASLAVATVSTRNGLAVIGHDAGPQVVVTANLYFALSDMDAQVASVLLAGGGRQDALDRYRQRRAQAGRALLRASVLAGEDTADRRTVREVLQGLGRYEQLTARALLLAEQAGSAPGSPSPEALATYREAASLMNLQLLPQAYDLTVDSGTIVRQTGESTSAAVRAGRVVVAVGGVLALGCLVWLQVFLARRFHRRLNPALLVATAVTVMYTFTGVVILGKEATALRTAEQDGFDAILALSRARTVSNSMYADQSRLLLDPARAGTYEQDYLDKSRSLLDLGDGDLASYYDELQRLADGAPPPGTIPGLLGDEATGDVLTTYAQFQQGDRELRELARGGDTTGAVTAWLETSTARFEAYHREILLRTGEHRDVFERAVGDGEDAMDGMEFLLPVAMLTIAVLVVAGVVPRLREYR